MKFPDEIRRLCPLRIIFCCYLCASSSIATYTKMQIRRKYAPIFAISLENVSNYVVLKMVFVSNGKSEPHRRCIVLFGTQIKQTKEWEINRNKWMQSLSSASCVRMPTAAFLVATFTIYLFERLHGSVFVAFAVQIVIAVDGIVGCAIVSAPIWTSSSSQLAAHFKTYAFSSVAPPTSHHNNSRDLHFRIMFPSSLSPPIHFGIPFTLHHHLCLIFWFEQIPFQP